MTINALPSWGSILKKGVETEKSSSPLISEKEIWSLIEEATQDSAAPNVNDDSNPFAQPMLEKPVKRSVESLLIELSALNTEFSNGLAGVTAEGIRSDLSTKQKLHQERLQKVKESANKMKEARKAGFFAKIFGWISSAGTMALGAICLASGVGAGAGIALIASSTLMITSQISAEYGDDFLNKFVSVAFKAFGMDEESSLLAAQIAVTAVIGVLGIGGCIGLISTAEKIGELIGPIYAVAQLITGIGMVGKGSADITTAIITKQAKDQEATSLEIGAAIKRLMYWIKNNETTFQTIIETINENNSKVSDIIDDTRTSKMAIISRIKTV